MASKMDSAACDNITLRWIANGRGKPAVIAQRGEEVLHTERIDLLDSKARERLAARLHQMLGTPPARLQETLLRFGVEWIAQQQADEADRAAAQQAAQQGNDDPSESITPPWPEPWPEPVTLKEALDATLEAIHRHVVLAKEAAVATALWTLWTYGVDRSPTGPAGDIAPFLTIVSPVRRCGKTQLLSVLAYLCPRVIPVSNISPSALFRLVEAEKPTLLIDEGDAFLKDNEPLRCLLNASHRRDGAYVVRSVEGDRDFAPRKFSVWAPKALAMIGSPASTIEDRSIIIKLQRKRRDEVVERLNAAAAERLREIARRLMAAVTPEVRAAMYAADPEIPAVLNDRQSDNWRSLLSLADLAGGHWPTLARQAAVVLSGAEGETEDLGVRLLLDCVAIFDADDELPARALADRLGELPESPWPTYRYGKPISADQVGRMLRRFGIKPRKTKTGNVYRRDDVQAAAARYSPTPPDPSSTSSTLDANPCGTSTYGVELSESPSSTLHPTSTHLNPDVTSTYDDGGSSGSKKPPVPENVEEWVF